MNSIATVKTIPTIALGGMTLSQIEAAAASIGVTLDLNRRASLTRQRQAAIDAIVDAGFKVETGCTTRGFAVAP